MNLATMIDDHPADSVALVAGTETITFGELRDQVAGVRGGLAGLGLVPGDRVAILCSNNRWFPVAYLAVLGLGCVAVPLNPTSPAPELERELLAVGARAVIAGPSGAVALGGLDRDRLPELEHVVVPSAAGLAGAQRLEDLLGARPVEVALRGDGDLAALLFTAGTAGSPKAAMLTHGSLLANIRQVQSLPVRRVVPADVCLGVLPLFHIFGLNVVLGLSLHAGASVVLVERFDPSSTLELVRDQGCTIVPGAPPIWVAWANLPDADPDSLASVRLAVSGAARLPADAAAAVRERFGVSISEGYGLTEASPIVTSSATDGSDRPGSVGRPIPGVEVRLIEDGSDVLLGDPGEIWIRGDNVFAGYWEGAEATAAALTDDGWLRTGDVAVADDEGNLTLVDRAKDLIIVSGFNVFPAEVEEVLHQHPGVERAAVVGVSHPYTGEAVKAVVVPADGHALEVEEVIAFCAEHLARYKCPTVVDVVTTLPEGLGGKVLRRSIR